MRYQRIAAAAVRRWDRVTCREFTEFLMQYLDGELAEAQRVVFDQHLAECPSCTGYLQNYRQTIDLTKGAFATDGPLPDDVPPELVRAILAARRSKGDRMT